MRVYADTSFLVRLLTQEPGTTSAIADYRTLGRPPIFFLPLHRLEVGNAIRQRAFQARRYAHAYRQQGIISRERDAALALLGRFISRRAFVEVTLDMELAIGVAGALSEKHTERLCCRGFDLLHVAMALELQCESFLTCDHIQAALARAEGLKVTISAEE